MKNYLVLALAIFMLFSCKKGVQSDFTLVGTVKGLKKGTVYLQKFPDSSYVTLDSVELNGTSSFELHSELKEPQVFFLKLDKNDNDDARIPFFADTGVTTIESTLKHFNLDAKVTGSEQQKLLDEYMVIMTRLNNQNLDMLKEKLEQMKASDSNSANTLDDYQNNFQRRKYRYTINFALNNANSEVAPYLALYEVPNTSIKYLDSIYNSLEEPIKRSLYGKKLNTYIEERKATGL